VENTHKNVVYVSQHTGIRYCFATAGRGGKKKVSKNSFEREQKTKTKANALLLNFGSDSGMKHREEVEENERKN
jgi:hypothetical protein